MWLFLGVGVSVYEGGGRERERWEVPSQVFCQSLFAFLLLMLFQLELHAVFCF